MSYTMADFRRDYVKEHLKKLSPAERIEGLSPEALLEALSRKQIVQLWKKLQVVHSTQRDKPRRKR